MQSYGSPENKTEQKWVKKSSPDISINHTRSNDGKMSDKEKAKSQRAAGDLGTTYDLTSTQKYLLLWWKSKHTQKSTS